MTATPLYIPPTASVYVPAQSVGVPEPPAEIIERLKRIHPALSLRFADGRAGSGWAVTWEWPKADRRWEWVQSGETPASSAYDTIGYLPFGCGVNEAPGYVEKSFKSYPRDEVRALADRIHHWNHAEVSGEQIGSLVAEAVEQTMRDARQKTPRRVRVKTIDG